MKVLASVLARMLAMEKAPMMVDSKDPESIIKKRDAFFRLLITENI